MLTVSLSTKEEPCPGELLLAPVPVQLLNINFKGVHMKLKIVGLAISVEKLIFTNF